MSDRKEIYMSTWFQANLFGIAALVTTFLTCAASFLVLQSEATMIAMVLSAWASVFGWFAMAMFMTSAHLDLVSDGIAANGQRASEAADKFQMGSVLLCGLAYALLIYAAWQHFYG